MQRLFDLVALPKKLRFRPRSCELHRRFHKSIAARAPGELHLDLGDATIEICPGAADRVEIEAVYHARIEHPTREPDFRLDVREGPDGVRAVGREVAVDGSSLGGYTRRLQRYMARVWAPADLALTVRGKDGDVDVRDWRGPVDCRLKDGSLRIVGCRGQVRARLDDGDLQVWDCRTDDGVIALGTADGSLDLQGVDAPRVRVRTLDGDVRARLPARPEAEVSIATIDGAVLLDLDPAWAGEFGVSASHGEIRTELPPGANVERRERRMVPGTGGRTWEGRRVRGTLGRGQMKVSVTTVDGEVTVRQAAP